VSQLRTDGTRELTAIECAEEYSFNKGCKLQRKVHVTHEH
jgi:hypothetical protein